MNDFEKKQASQNKPASEAVSTESLNAMSPAALADALELTLDLMAEENYDPDLIDAYLDALDEKAPMPEGPGGEERFAALTDRLGSIFLGNQASSREHKSADTVRRYPLKRVFVTAAATVALLFTLMVGAQAAGIDVFGNLARWTNEVFFFLSSTEENEFSASLQQALERAELPKELAPTWFPEGFTAEEPEFWDDDVSTAVGISFVNPEGKNFIASIDFYKEAGAIGTLPFEKDAGDVEVYTSKNRTFYIMSNVNIHFAVWTDGNLLESIRGDLSVDQIKAMIDSIGG